MHVRTIGAVSALALFAGVSTAALAQAPGAERPGTQERMQTPGQGGQQMPPGQKERGGEQTQTPKRGEGQAQQQQQRSEQPEPKQRKQAEQPERKQQKQAEQPERKQQKQAEQPERKQRQQAEQPERKQPQRAEQPERKQPKRAEQPDRKQQQAERAERPRLSEQQRTTVRERIREGGALERGRVASVDFNVRVGTRVPTRINLAPLPAVIVEEVPAYRGYVYFVVRDELVIVEPSTHVIVDVIRLEGAPARAARVEGRLTLTPEQRRIVLSRVDMKPAVRLGIGDINVGMNLPRNVELRSFPQAVTSEIPKLREYRYIVFENDVVIVSPSQRQVVLTISE